MSIPALSSITSPSFTPRVDSGSKGSPASGSGFGDLVNNALENVNTQQAKADNLAEQAAVGQLRDPHEYMIAATEASLTTELTVAVRNKAVEAFNDIMRMSI
jgi:flagellar hook-basal body complex protein FliE